MVSALVADLADRYESMSADLRAVAERFPGAYVVRNEMGNLAIIRPAGEYSGYVDVLTGEVVAFAADGNPMAEQ